MMDGHGDCGDHLINGDAAADGAYGIPMKPHEVQQIGRAHV